MTIVNLALAPGLLGYSRFGPIYYFNGVAAHLRSVLPDVRVLPTRTAPLGTVAFRAKLLVGIDVGGTSVEEGRASAPYRLISQPTMEARERSNPSLDLRINLARDLPPGTAIYHVLALGEREEAEINPHGTAAVEELATVGRTIREISTRSEFIASHDGDYRLFFKHNDRFTRDRQRTASGSGVSGLGEAA